MPSVRYESSLLFQAATRLAAFGVLVPGLVWLASNYVATSPLLAGFAFRDLSALGLFAVAGSAVAKLYGNMYRAG